MGTIAALNLSAQQCCETVGEDGPMHVGKRLKKLMQEKGISTEAMAARCEVTPGAVSNWFATGHIARDNLVVVADALGESLRYLITGDPRDRVLSLLETEFAKRDVSDGTLQAILTLIRSSPLRAPDALEPEPEPDEDQQEADAQAFKRSLETPKPPRKPAPSPQRDKKKP